VPARSPLDRDDLNVAAEIRGDATDKPAATVKRKSSHGWGTLPKRSVVRLRKIIETLKWVPDLLIMGCDAVVRLAAKSQQNEVTNNAEAATNAVGELVAAIRKLP
jgi:hypothetical protein